MHTAHWLSTGSYKTPSWWIKSKWMRTIWINILWNTPRIKKFKKNSSWQTYFCRFCWNESVWKIVWSVLWNPNFKVPNFRSHRAKVMMLNPQEGEGNGLILGGDQRAYCLDHFGRVIQIKIHFRVYSTEIKRRALGSLFLNLFLLISFLSGLFRQFFSDPSHKILLLKMYCTSVYIFAS